jgi:hypothetical protein
MMYCRKCNYNLAGNRSRTCPECGRPFDPADPTSFRVKPERLKNAWIILAIYLAPLALSLLFWLVKMEGDWGPRPRGAAPVDDVLSIWMWQATGPLALPVGMADTPMLIHLTFLCVWPGYLALVLRTRLRQLPYVVHAVFACAWCCSGCMLAVVALSQV